MSGETKEKARKILYRIVETHTALRHEVPESFDDDDWYIVASGIVMGKGRHAIAGELSAKWRVAGEDGKIEGGYWEMLHYMDQSLKAFKSQKAVLKRFLKEPWGDFVFDVKGIQMYVIDSYIKLLDASITSKVAAGCNIANFDMELTQLERLLKLARIDSDGH